jgi:hypothetical protein
MTTSYRTPVLDTFCWQPSVITKGTLTPPGSPTKGDRYIIGGTGVGGWTGHDQAITYWDGAAWQFNTPAPGWITWVTDEGYFYVFSGGIWFYLIPWIAHHLFGGNSTTQRGSIPFQSDLNVTSRLLPNTTTTKKFLRMTGDGTNGADPAWDIVHDPVTVNAPIALATQALSLVNNAGAPGTITAFDIGALANSDTVIPTSKAVTTALAGIGGVSEAELDVLRDNEILLAWQLAIHAGLALFNLEDGVTDEFEDETGVNTGACVNQSYNSIDDYYYPTGGEYGSDILTGGTATASDYFGSQTPNLAVDNNEATYWWTSLAPSQWWKYDLGAGVTKTVTKLRMKSYSERAKDFTLAGSNNDAAWTDIYTGQHTNDDNWQDFTFANTTAYRYYRITFSSVWSSTPGIYEIEMIESLAYNNMTLVSNNKEAEAQPTTGRFMALVEPVDALTLNTDIKGWISEDNGSNFDQVTLTDEGYFDATKKIYAANVTLTNRSDKTMVEKITTLNNKNLKVHAWAMMWR